MKGVDGLTLFLYILPNAVRNTAERRYNEESEHKPLKHNYHMCMYIVEFVVTAT